MICYFCKKDRHDDCMSIPVKDNEDCSFGIQLLKCECTH